MSEVDDVRRATAILNVAMQHKMFPQGAIPESDSAKLVEAEKIVVMARQAKQIGDRIGPAKIKHWNAIQEILFEADVTVGTGDAPAANGSAPSTQTPQPQEQTPSPSSSPASPPASPPSATSSAAPATSAPATPAPPASLSPEQPSSSSPGTSSQAPAEPSSGGFAPLEVWSAPGGGQWRVKRDLGPQVEVESMATGEATLVPSGFLKDKVQEGFIAVSVDPEQHVEGAPGFNALYYEHPGCSRWVVPLDDMELPLVGEERECSNCAVVLPIKTVEANGYVPPSQRQPEPQPDPEPEPEPRPEPEPKPTAKPRARRKPKAKTVAEPTTGAPVDEDEGDEEYASLLDAVDADYAVPGMPAPQDLENPPELGALEDPTEDEAGNRVLHMQYNALFARARYLYGIENAKARNCGRVRKRYMKPAMRAARTELGKDATQTEVVSLAENDEAVAKWTQRQERHADRADAYKTFMEIYAENVKTLSRDLTWAGAEERGS